eukprot:UN26355
MRLLYEIACEEFIGKCIDMEKKAMNDKQEFQWALDDSVEQSLNKILEPIKKRGVKIVQT